MVLFEPVALFDFELRRRQVLAASGRLQYSLKKETNSSNSCDLDYDPLKKLKQTSMNKGCTKTLNGKL